MPKSYPVGWRQATMIKQAESVLVTYYRYSLYKYALPVAAAGGTFLFRDKAGDDEAGKSGWPEILSQMKV